MIFISSSNKWLLLADMHLDKYAYDDKREDAVIESLRTAPDEYGLIIIGDFLSPGFSLQDARIYHSLLMNEILKRKTIFLNGNNDPYIGYDAASIFNRDLNEYIKIKHGHTVPKLVCSFFNIFKIKKDIDVTWKKREKLDKAFRLLSFLNKRKDIVIGHYHFEYFDDDHFVGVLAPRKIYYFDRLFK